MESVLLLNILIIHVMSCNFDLCPLELVIDLFKLNNQNDPEVALSTFESLLLIHPTSIAAIYGRARALELLAERTNDYSAVQRSIDTHEELILTMDTDLEDTIFKEISSTCLFRLRSLGESLINDCSLSFRNGYNSANLCRIV